MALRDHFEASLWIGHALTGRPARRVYVTMVLLFLVATTVVRAYAFVLTRRIQAVIYGLSKLRIDETTEEELVRTVPYLVRGNWDGRVVRTVELGNVDTGVERGYYISISNQANWMKFENFAWNVSSFKSTKDGRQRGWVFALADWFGYRYLGFGARVILLDGRVSSIEYGIENRLVFPQVFGSIVSVASAHARWAPHETSFDVSSTDDESPQFHVGGDDRHLAVLFTSEASPALMSHVFRVQLSCFWGLIGCRHARQIAPLMWQDKNSIEVATLARLNSNDPCPDRILEGRMKYLLDMGVVLLESTGFKTQSVNEERLRVDENWTNYKLIEVLRGRSSKSWESVRGSVTVPYPGNYRRSLPNMGLQWVEAGERVLVFSNLHFDSCRVVPAKPSGLSVVRNTVPAPRRAEDGQVTGLL